MCAHTNWSRWMLHYVATYVATLLRSCTTLQKFSVQLYNCLYFSLSLSLSLSLSSTLSQQTTVAPSNSTWSPAAVHSLEACRWHSCVICLTHVWRGRPGFSTQPCLGVPLVIASTAAWNASWAGAPGESYLTCPNRASWRFVDIRQVGLHSDVDIQDKVIPPDSKDSSLALHAECL